MSAKELIQAIAVTSELCGTALSGPAQKMMVDDLSAYPEASVIEALSRCRRELKGRLTLSEIISRIDDGRPGVEEAWALVPRTEEETTVWTEEICAAWGVAYPLLQRGEEISARMAFKEAYTQFVIEARGDRTPVTWRGTLGFDKSLREPVLLKAVSKGRLTSAQVMTLLPFHISSPEFLALLSSAETKSGAEIKRIGK